MTNKQHRITTRKITILGGVPLFLLASLVAMSMPTAHAGVLDALLNCDDLQVGMVPFDIQAIDGVGTIAKCYDPTDSCFANGILALQAVPQPCQFGIAITYAVAAPSDDAIAILADAIPAEWEVTTITDLRGECDWNQANKGKKANKSATKITCEIQVVDFGGPVHQAAAIVDIQTRESPSSFGKDKDPKFKPTFACEGTPDRNFPVNDGVQAVAIDADGNIITWDHDLDILTPEVPLVLAQTAALSTTAVDEDDLDCDGIPNSEDGEDDRPFTDNGFV